MNYRNILKINLLILSIIIFSLVACEKSTNVVKDKNVNGPFYSGDDEIYYSLMAYQVYFQSVSLSEYDTLMNSRYLPSNIHFYTVEQVDSVFFNNSKLDYHQEGNYYKFGDSISFQLNHWNYFHVYGNINSPSILDSLLSPESFSLVTYPQNGGIINKNSNLTITWDSDNSNESVIIILIPEIQSGSSGDIYIETIDDGSHTISANDLSNLQNGKVNVNFMKGKYKIGIASDNKKYLISVWSEHQFKIFLNE